MPTAFITGITGQDGSYLTELLLGIGYTVHGMVRRTSVLERSRIEHLRADPEVYNQRLFLHYGDLTDTTTLRRLLVRTRPEEIYHLAGQSQPGLSFEIPESTVQETAIATLALLEIVRDLEHGTRLFLAASSEVFGTPTTAPQDEDTPFRPVNPYGCAKAFAAQLARVYRQAHGLYLSVGIAYNHESPRRGESFVTRKITRAASRIAAGSPEVLELGNLNAARDWGWAPEYVEAMWRSLQRTVADDYVLATGTSTTVRDFVRAAFEEHSMPLVFEGEGLSETARHAEDGRLLLRINPRYYRSADPAGLVGDPSHAASTLAWRATCTGPDVARAMARSETGSGPLAL